MKREVPSLIVLAGLALAAGAAQAIAAPPNKVTICHNTSSPTNPFVVITVSENAVQTHLSQHGDVLFINGQCGGGGGS